MNWLFEDHVSYVNYLVSTACLITCLGGLSDSLDKLILKAELQWFLQLFQAKDICFKVKPSPLYVFSPFFAVLLGTFFGWNWVLLSRIIIFFCGDGYLGGIIPSESDSRFRCSGTRTILML